MKQQAKSAVFFFLLLHKDANSSKKTIKQFKSLLQEEKKPNFYLTAVIKKTGDFNSPVFLIICRYY
jgi:hypothetical protein